MKQKVTIKKFGGDDKLSWAVFVDGSPVVTGLGRDEAKYHQRIIKLKLEKRS